MNKKSLRISNLIYDPVRYKLQDTSAPQFLETLSASEHKILMHLFEHQHSITSKPDLENIGWGGRPVSSSSLSVALASLRKKLSRDNSIEIRNIQGEGYVLHVEENEFNDNLNNIAKLLSSVGKNISCKVTLRLCTSFSILGVALFLLDFWALKADFKCEVFGKSLYCYMGNPSDSARAEALKNSKQQLFFYSPSNSSEVIHEKY